MARFSLDEAENYNSQSTSSYFSLKNDRDTAKVRFLYDSVDDLEGYAVHEVEMEDGKKRYVNCLRAYNEPLEKCPFCAARMPIKAKLYLKLYNEDAEECQIWERGKSYFAKIASLSSRYYPLYNKVIEIERNGKAGDMKTTYEFYPIDKCEEIDIEDEKYDCTEPLGTIIMDKTADEMDEFLDTGRFPSGTETVANSREDRRNNNDMPTGRRTPSRRAF